MDYYFQNIGTVFLIGELLSFVFLGAAIWRCPIKIWEKHLGKQAWENT